MGNESPPVFSPSPAQYPPPGQPVSPTGYPAGNPPAYPPQFGLTPQQTGQGYQEAQATPQAFQNAVPLQPVHTGSQHQQFGSVGGQAGQVPQQAFQPQQAYVTAMPNQQMYPMGMQGQPMQMQMQPQMTGMYVQQGMSPQVTGMYVVQQPMMAFTPTTPLQGLGQWSSSVKCPNCGQTNPTKLSYQSGSATHFWALIIGVLTCLCCIPYVLNGMKDVLHTCPNCGIQLAIWHRMSGDTQVIAPQNVQVQQGMPGMQPMGMQPTMPMSPVGQPQQMQSPMQTGMPALPYQQQQQQPVMQTQPLGEVPK